jgi:hypothetical protein
MGRVLAAAALLALPGCAQVFGIKNTSEAADAAVDAPVPQVLIAFEKVSIGASTVRASADLTNFTADWLVVDASDPSGLRKVPGTLSPIKDRWSAEIATGSPAVDVSGVPEPVTFRRQYDFQQRTILSEFFAWEHPGSEPAPVGAKFTPKITLPSGYIGTESFQMWAVGPWAIHTFSAAELPAAGVGAVVIQPTGGIAYDQIQFPAVFSGVPLAKLTSADQIVIVRHDSAAANGPNAMTAHAIVAPFDQTGGTDAITVTMSVTTRAAMDVFVKPTEATARYNGVLPAVGAPSMSYSVVAAPGFAEDSNNGPVLISNAVAVAADPVHIVTQYGNPFATPLGWKSIFTWSTTATRAITVGTLASTLRAGMYEVAEPLAATTFDLPAGLPALVSIGSQPLNTDNVTVTLEAGKSVQVSLTADRTANTFHQFNVYELTPNAGNTALVQTLRYVALATDAEATIPGNVFTTGGKYFVRGHCIKGGYPMFAIGNLRARDLPYSVGYLDSGWFTVAAP